MSTDNLDKDDVLLGKILATDLGKQERLARFLTMLAYFVFPTFLVVAFVGRDSSVMIIGILTSMMILFLGKARAGYARLYRLIQREERKKRLS